MITARVTRLVRVPDLRGLRATLAELTSAPAAIVRRTAVLVPSRGAAEELRRSLEASAFARGDAACIHPDILTRAEFYAALHASLPAAPRLLSPQEREVLLRRAAREAVEAGAIPPFRLRAGLVLQMLEFYDELRRREATLDDFERNTIAPLSDSADTDRGAERLLRQTEFLLAAFGGFERLVAASGCVDEHGLRALLIGAAANHVPYRRIVVAMQDQSADPRGLYASDFVLLSQLPGITELDVIATEGTLGAGFHERLHQLLPGLDEVRRGTPSAPPRLVAPESTEPEVRWLVARDREEELAGFVRRLKLRAASAHESERPPALDRVGIVFQRPLPYLYLARQVFQDGGIPWQALDALPLSAEPFAATIDVVLSFVTAEGNRASIAELLRCPHLVFSTQVEERAATALGNRLLEIKYPGGWDRLDTLRLPRARDGEEAALDLARTAARHLRQVQDSAQASTQLDLLLAFFQTFERLPEVNDDWVERHLRARAAVMSALTALRDAHRLHDDSRLDLTELGGTIRRWIDAQTFAPVVGADGVRLLDAVAAPFADVDEVHLVGLVERDWPEPPRRNIFYPSAMLSNLGWPADAARTPAARAAFLDLLHSPSARVSVSVFTLEDDSIVSPSPFLEEIETTGMEVQREPAVPAARVFVHEAVQHGDLGPRSGPVAGDDWLALRVSRPPAEDPRFAGQTGPRPPDTYAISYLERYLECPFKYFANRVLKLPEERDEEAGLTPIERGHLLHGVFETFFREWDRQGRGTITRANVADALAMFAEVAEARIQELPEADRALERTHLLGSAAASGLAERAFAFEIEQGGTVVERLLEHELEGEFTFAGSAGPRRIRIRAKADRLDLMADGTIRVIDYKLGKAPKTSRSLQLPIYGVIAQQALEGRRGRSWSVAAAGYVAFREREPFVSLGGRTSAIGAAIADGQQRLIDAVEGIERGHFPVKPDEPYRCQWCAYAGVCRKDYVGDE